MFRGGLLRWGDENTLKFILLYKENECLWNVNSEFYKNKNARESAYREMIDLMQYPMLNMENIKMKIKNLRSVYHQELSKIRRAERAGKPPYVPTLSWFNTMHSFLEDAVAHRDKKLPHPDVSFADTDSEETVRTTIIPIAPKSTLGQTSFKKSRTRKRKMIPIKTEIIEPTPVPEREDESIEPEDSYGIFGKHVANKLRTLENQQNIFAQKLINDILFEGEMETLSRNYKIVDAADPLHLFPSSASQ